MRRCTRRAISLPASAVVFLALAWPCERARLWVMRETYQLAEFVGIMDPTGSLGGQVLGHNFQREPAWMHDAAAGVGAFIAYTPPLALSLLVMHRVAGGRGARPTLCGGCGSVLRGLTEARCPKCRRAF